MKLADIKPLRENAYHGNIGAMEMFQFYQHATPAQIKEMKAFISSKNFKKAWELLKRVTGVDLEDLEIAA